MSRFAFNVPVSFFEKAAAPQGRQRRIGGIVSTETRDRQGEILLQRGLDFDPFLHHGWYNDNHSKKTCDILGYPDSVKFFKKGDALPDGTQAKSDGHWAEGYLLDTAKANEVWELGNALQKSGRRLGFSVEGNITKRVGPGKKTIAKATVKNVAITNSPVNSDTRLETLAKSLHAAERGEELYTADELREAVREEITKALGMGTTAPGFTPGVKPSGPQTGESAGQVLAPQSLETDERYTTDKLKKRKKKKKLTKSEAVAQVQRRLPQIPFETAVRIVRVAADMKKTGIL